MKQTYFLVLCIVLGAVSGALAGVLVVKSHKVNYVSEFYSAETAVSVSPHHLRKAMSKGDNSFILVDLRSQEEYEEAHIKGAINIPAYKDRDHSDYGAVQRIISEFSVLPTDRDVIVYCYSIPCMTGRKVGKILSDNGIYVKALEVGWNEWRYHWEMWNHEHEWNQTDVMDYIEFGPDPGVPKLGLGSGCPVDGDLGC